MLNATIDNWYDGFGNSSLESARPELGRIHKNWSRSWGNPFGISREARESCSPYAFGDWSNYRLPYRVNTGGFEIARILEEESVPLESFIWVHATRDISENHLRAARLGMWISIDNLRENAQLLRSNEIEESQSGRLSGACIGFSGCGIIVPSRRMAEISPLTAL